MAQKANEKQRLATVIKRLRSVYQKTKADFVLFENPLELLIATVLSAQCTDKVVNRVTSTLFQKYKTAEDYAEADLAVLEQEIFSTVFYRSKARYLKNIGIMLTQKHGGRVPDTLEDLLQLPGVSHKTANLIMAKAFGKYTGMAVDTHVRRLAPRLGFAKGKNPNQISKELENIADAEDYLDVNEMFILHGRKICVSVPKCGECILRDICPTGKKKT